ncbi:MAG: FAD-dependent monooxygenase [Saprospiraceae bacterium]|nr:FAD-dependent monooxygenase [Saprospiraceae bacterium]
MPDLIEDFYENPTSSLCTIKCFPWQVDGKVALMGDAAHAVVPFYGQGMNASFEDCVVLDACMDQYPGDWNHILSAYETARKVNGDAIGDLAVDNFYEMKAATADPVLPEKEDRTGSRTKLSRLFQQIQHGDLQRRPALQNGYGQSQRPGTLLMQYARNIYPGQE